MHHQWMIRDKYLAIPPRVQCLLLKAGTSFPNFLDHTFLHWAGGKCWKLTSYEHCPIWFHSWWDLTVAYYQAALFQCLGHTPRSADNIFCTMMDVTGFVILQDKHSLLWPGKCSSVAVSGRCKHISMCTKKSPLIPARLAYFLLGIRGLMNLLCNWCTVAIRKLKTGGCSVNTGNLPMSVTSWSRDEAEAYPMKSRCSKVYSDPLATSSFTLILLTF